MFSLAEATTLTGDNQAPNQSASFQVSDRDLDLLVREAEPRTNVRQAGSIVPGLIRVVEEEIQYDALIHRCQLPRKKKGQSRIESPVISNIGVPLGPYVGSPDSVAQIAIYTHLPVTQSTPR